LDITLGKERQEMHTSWLLATQKIEWGGAILLKWIIRK